MSSTALGHDERLPLYQRLRDEMLAKIAAGEWLPGEAIPTEAELRALMTEHRFRIESLSYRTRDEGRQFEYRMMLRTHDRHCLPRLATALRNHPFLMDFQLSPSGD